MIGRALNHTLGHRDRASDHGGHVRFTAVTTHEVAAASWVAHTAAWTLAAPQTLTVRVSPGAQAESRQCAWVTSAQQVVAADHVRVVGSGVAPAPVRVSTGRRNTVTAAAA